MSSIKEYIEIALKRNASDVYIAAGKPICIKSANGIETLDDDMINIQKSTEYIRELYTMSHRKLVFGEDSSFYDDDFSVSVPGLARLRVNVFRQRSTLAAVVRIIKFGIPNYEELNIPETIMDFSNNSHGLLLVTGPTSSGKSTTVACIIDRINKTYNKSIITIEDPIEFMFRNNKCLICQRELITDTESFKIALKSSLRQSPDIIFIGEMRDPETISVAITAAETGHLVISTLHTSNAAGSISRIIDCFPGDQQNQIRLQLSQCLVGVVSQQLVSSVDGKYLPVFEIMRSNIAIKNLIRDNRIHQIDQQIQQNERDGMLLMDDSILELYYKNLISKKVAMSACIHADVVSKKL